MATRHTYNHSAKRFLAGENAVSDTYKVVLLSSSASFDATDTTLAEVTNSGAWEVYGNGWTQGGEEITNLAAEIINTDEGAVTADDLAVNVIGGDLGPFSYYVIVNTTDTDSPPVEFVELTTPVTVSNGHIAQIPWPNGRVFTSAPSP